MCGCSKVDNLREAGPRDVPWGLSPDIGAACLSSDSYVNYTYTVFIYIYITIYIYVHINILLYNTVYIYIIIHIYILTYTCTIMQTFANNVFI